MPAAKQARHRIIEAALRLSDFESERREFGPQRSGSCCFPSQCGERRINGAGGHRGAIMALVSKCPTLRSPQWPLTAIPKCSR